MKNTFFSIILFSISSLLTAQELPELPMKNGMAYYTFEHKLDNKECLAKYFNNPNPLKTKVNNYCSQLNYQKKEIYKKTPTFEVDIPWIHSSRTKCLDTLKKQQGFSLSSKGYIQWFTGIIELARKKILRSDIDAQIDIIFISETEYKLVFKDLTYHIYWAQGTKNGIDIHNIGELYQKTKDSGKINKKDVKFFEDLNFYIKSADEIILKSLTETYKAAEL